VASFPDNQYQKVKPSWMEKEMALVTTVVLIMCKAPVTFLMPLVCGQQSTAFITKTQLLLTKFAKKS